MILKLPFIFCCAFGVMILASCNGSNNAPADTHKPDSTTTAQHTQPPAFNADTAYAYVAAQVAFGPRTPGSAAQKKCADWMQQHLAQFCDTVYRQDAIVDGGDRHNGHAVKLPCINLIGVLHPKATNRILLLAHWDSRPWADQDTKDKDKPILAADDGGSGVAVLLELARELKSKPLPENLGVDILFTDVEDYGKTEWGEDSYCLGTQYWAQHPHVPGYHAAMGVLLDMVGARDSRFPMERSSTNYAQSVQQRVWTAAADAGYSGFFPPTPSDGGITDDHVFVNDMAHIPTIDIIALRNGSDSPFPAHWHTHGDTMAVIDKSTLQAVGQTLLQFLMETAQPS